MTDNIVPIRPIQIHDVDHLPLLEKLIAVLETEPDLVRQQIAIELLAVRMALRLRDKAAATLFADGFTRHVRRMIQQCPRDDLL